MSRPADQDHQGRPAAGRPAEGRSCTTAACRTGISRTSTPSSRRCARRRSAASRSRRASATTCSIRRWTPCSSATSARCAQLIRQTVPEKKQYFEDYICDDGLNMGPYKIACTMWREGDKCIFDFAGTDPQSISSINFLLNEEMFKMFAGVYMIMVFDPQILFNDGFYDLMEVRIPPGTLLKPLKPAALSCRTHALGRIFDILGGLLGQGNPAFMCAAGLLRQPALHVLGVRQERRVVPAVPDHASAASRASRSATARTATRCGPRSPTCRTSSSRAISRCASTSTRRSPTRAAPARIAAATACGSATGSSSRARSRSTTTAGSPTPGASTAACPARAARRRWCARTARPRTAAVQDRPRQGRRRATCCSPTPGVAAAAAIRSSARSRRCEFDVQAGLVTPQGALNYGVVMKADLHGRQGRDREAAREAACRARASEAVRPRLRDDRELKGRCKAETGHEPPQQPKFSEQSAS